MSSVSNWVANPNPHNRVGPSPINELEKIRIDNLFWWVEKRKQHTLDRAPAKKMSISAIFGAAVPNCTSAARFGARKEYPRLGGGAAVIECSSRPQKKATSHHMKTRPRKTQPWDVKRRPTVYAPLPPLPPEWTLVSSDADAAPGAAVPAPTPPLPSE